MIVRAGVASRAFVCLRCELLAETTPSRALPRHGQLHTFGLQIRRNATDATTASSEPAEVFGEDKPAGSTWRRVAKKSPAWSQNHLSEGKPLAPKRVYNSRGTRLLAQEENLDIGILGSPAHAIVMRDGGIWRRHDEPTTTEDEHDAILSVESEVWEAVAHEDAEPTDTEVEANIEGLRAGLDDIIPLRDFELLKQTLQDGFTTAQLRAYAESHPPVRSAAKDIPDTENPPWVLQRWPWRPEVQTADDEDVGPSLQGYVASAMPAKEKLALRIVRETWGLSIQELMDGPGFLDVRLRDTEFSLLSLRGSKWAGKITQALLEPTTGRIELITSQKLLRVVAPRAVAGTIVDEIHNIIKTAQTRSLKFDAKITKQLVPKALVELSNITNAFVRPGAGGKELLATWIPAIRSDASVEDTGDKVERLVRSAYTAKPWETRSVSISSTCNSDTAQLLRQYPGQDKLPWTERHVSWARWTSPAVLDLETAVPRTDDVLPLAQLLKRAAPKHAQAKSPSISRAHSAWSLEEQTRIIVTFGHVLHAWSPDTASLATTSPSKFLLSSKGRRIFRSLAPPLRSLAHVGNGTDKSSSEILLHFLPNPGEAAGQPSVAPPLELRLRMTGSSTPAISSLRVIVCDSFHDVLQPEKTMDARVRQTCYFEIPAGELELDKLAPGIAAIRNFLTSSTLQPAEGHLLTPPRMLGILLPRALLQSDTEMPQILTDHHELDLSDLVEVDYNFAGFEVLHETLSEFSGFPLRYSTAEAGRGGGRRTELCLEASTPSTLEGSDQLTVFQKAVAQFVSGAMKGYTRQV